MAHFPTNMDQYGLFNPEDTMGFDFCPAVDFVNLVDVVPHGAGVDTASSPMVDVQKLQATSSDMDSNTGACDSIDTNEFFCDLTADDFLLDTVGTTQVQANGIEIDSTCGSALAQQIQPPTLPWLLHASDLQEDSSPDTNSISGNTTPALSASTASLNIPDGVFANVQPSPLGGEPEQLFCFGEGMMLVEVPEMASKKTQKQATKVTKSKQQRKKPHPITLPKGSLDRSPEPPQTEIKCAATTASVNREAELGDSDGTGNHIPKLEKKHRGRWSSEEDDALSQAVMTLGGKNWKKIAASLPSTKWTDMQCCHRWHFVLKPGLIKKPWSADEDKKLRELVAMNGPRNWGTIAEQMEGRLGKQCRERWCNNLAPEVNKKPWTLEEDRIIWDMQKKVGNQWADIAKALPGRTHNSVKNRWNGMIRKIDRRAKGSPARRGKNGFISQPWLADDNSESSSATPSTAVPTLQTDAGVPTNVVQASMSGTLEPLLNQQSQLQTCA